MFRNNRIYILILILFQYSCVSFEPQVLTDDYQLAVPEDKEKGVNALEFNGGVIESFTEEIYSWWVGNEQLTLTKVGDTLEVIANNVGPNYTPFGKQITTIDLSVCEAIRVRARATGKKNPILRIDLKDVNGMVANAAAPQCKIDKNGPYKYYYYSFKDKWKQGWPDAQKVDPTLIAEMMFFINPGMGGFTGKIYIDEIKAVPQSEIPVKESLPGGVVDNFEDEPTSWWTGSSKLNLEKVEDQDVAKLRSDGAGPSYETFGRGFEQMNCETAPIVKIKAKSKPDNNGPLPKLRVALKDKDGFVANEFNIINTIDSTGFKNYYYDFEGKFSQTYPDAHTVSPSGIGEILLFVNPGEGGYFGDIYFDEIEVITRKQYEEETKK